jgi:hypothetical protein
MTLLLFLVNANAITCVMQYYTISLFTTVVLIIIHIILTLKRMLFLYIFNILTVFNYVLRYIRVTLPIADVICISKF